MLKKALFLAVTTTIAASSLAGTALATEASNETYMCRGHVATIVGTPGHDSVQGGGQIIEGTDGPDVIVGLGGHDYINGWGGDDIICGGAGSDDLYGYSGDDILDGGDDNDSLEGNSGSDTMYLGDTGEFAPWWAATLRDGNIAAGDYTIWHEGPAGDDLIIGGPGTDGCIRSAGEWRGTDMMSGNGGDDRIEGRGGNDCMNSQSGNDVLLGGSGDDILEAGSGNDSAKGGTGKDICGAEETVSCGQFIRS